MKNNRKVVLFRRKRDEKFILTLAVRKSLHPHEVRMKNNRKVVLFRRKGPFRRLAERELGCR